MEEFTQRFQKRVIAMRFDKDAGVAVHAMRVASLLARTW